MAVPADRLRGADDVRHVLRRGRRGAGRFVVVHAIQRDDSGPGRVTVVASKKVGNAVERNRAKRVLREAVRAVGVEPGVDAALVARVGANEVPMSAVLTDLAQLFSGSAVGVPTGTRR